MLLRVLLMSTKNKIKTFKTPPGLRKSLKIFKQQLKQQKKSKKKK